MAGTGVPWWLTVVPGALSFLGAGLGTWVTRRNSKDADARWSREEGMRTLRWAVEKALDPDDDTSEVGWAIIGALAESGLLQPADLVFLDAVVNAKIGGTMQVLPPGDSKSAVDVLVEESEGE